jgi:hypothetical protein
MNLFKSKSKATESKVVEPKKSALESYSPQVLANLLINGTELQAMLQSINDLSGVSFIPAMVPGFVSKRDSDFMAKRLWNVLNARLAVTEEILQLDSSKIDVVDNQLAIAFDVAVNIKPEGKVVEFKKEKRKKLVNVAELDPEAIANATVIEPIEEVQGGSIVLNDEAIEGMLFANKSVKEALLKSTTLSEFESKLRKFRESLISDETALKLLNDWYIDVIQSKSVPGCEALTKLDSIQKRFDGVIVANLVRKTKAEENRELNKHLMTFKELYATASNLFKNGQYAEGCELIIKLVSTGNVLDSKSYIKKEPFKLYASISHARNQLSTYLKQNNIDLKTIDYIAILDEMKANALVLKPTEVVVTAEVSGAEVTTEIATNVKPVVTDSEWHDKMREMKDDLDGFLAWSKTVKHAVVHGDGTVFIADPINIGDAGNTAFFVYTNSKPVIKPVEVGNVVEATVVNQPQSSTEPQLDITSPINTTELTSSVTTVNEPFVADETKEVKNELYDKIIDAVIAKLTESKGIIKGNEFKTIVGEICTDTNSLSKSVRNQLLQRSKRLYSVRSNNVALAKADVEPKNETEDYKDRVIEPIVTEPEVVSTINPVILEAIEPIIEASAPVVTEIVNSIIETAVESVVEPVTEAVAEIATTDVVAKVYIKSESEILAEVIDIIKKDPNNKKDAFFLVKSWNDLAGHIAKGKAQTKAIWTMINKQIELVKAEMLATPEVAIA